VSNWRNVSDALAEPYTPPTATIAAKPAIYDLFIPRAYARRPGTASGASPGNRDSPSSARDRVRPVVEEFR